MAKEVNEALVDPVRSDDPKRDEKKGKKDAKESSEAEVKKGEEGQKGKKGQEQELNEEDAALKEELEMLVERLRESNVGLYRPALETLRSLIRTSTSSMTSVPKPLKFLRPHYAELKAIYHSWGSTADHERAVKEDERTEKEAKQARAEEKKREVAPAATGTATPTAGPSTGGGPHTNGTDTPATPNGDAAAKSKPADLGKVAALAAAAAASSLAPSAISKSSEPAPARPLPKPGSVKGVPPADHSLLADIISVLAMTYSDSGKRETLAFRLRGHRGDAAKGIEGEDPGLWGHEYVRHLAAEIGEAFQAGSSREDEEASKAAAGDGEDATMKDESAFQDRAEEVEELHLLTMRIVPFLLNHNAETDAVDLLLELEAIEDIVPLVAEHNFARVCNYMLSCVNYLVPPDDADFLKTARGIYRAQSRFAEAMLVSIRMNDQVGVAEDFDAPSNPAMRLQLAHILARHQLPALSADLTDDEKLVEALNNTKLTEHFKAFGKNLNVLEPRSLEDVYKSHLEVSRGVAGSANVDSARQNLAGTFVNAFVNAGFGNDKLMADAEEGQSWIYKNKDHGMMSAAASLGLSLLWDTEGGLSAIDKYTYATEEHIKAGALLANGLLHSGVRTEMDVALALLADHVESASVPLRVSAAIAIGVAHAGTHREDVMELLLPHVGDTSLSVEVAATTALALGFVFAGSSNGDVAGTILQTMMERPDSELSDRWSRYLGLALAMLYIGRQDDCDATVETLKAIEHPVANQALILVDACAFAGTGNVLKVQEMLHQCNDHVTSEKEDDKEKEDEIQKATLHQQLAVLGIALIAMGEEVGAEMSLRQFGHLMQYGEAPIRRAVPLALGLVSVSNPALPILDTLSKYSHDNDLAVALNAIFAMGLVGAGTNNAKLAQLLRQLASYYYKEADCLFMVRVAQGLVHMGKGTLGLAPFHTDRQLMSPVAVAGLLATIVAFTDAKSFILEKYHWLLFLLTPAMTPRYLMTFDEEGNMIETSVRVGQAVDTVGLAGKPKSISGFQTHTAPVRLGTTERAELATEEYIPFTNVLEGLVLLAKNAGFEDESK